MVCQSQSLFKESEILPPLDLRKKKREKISNIPGYPKYPSNVVSHPVFLFATPPKEYCFCSNAMDKVAREYY